MSEDMFEVGAACVDVTPPFTVPYLSSVPRHGFFRGIHDPLLAKAVVVAHGERRVALVTVDSLGIARRVAGEGRDFIEEVRQRVHEACGIPSENVMICATHAHSTPDTCGFRPLQQHPGAQDWIEVFRDQLASAAIMADQIRAPARLKVARGSAEGVGWSRRMRTKDGRICHYANRPGDEEIADWGVNDHEVVVMCFERFDGAPAIVLTHFACHPTTVQVNPLTSADFPGVTTALVERSVAGCEQALFLQGACGSIVPVRRTTDFDDVTRYGWTLAGETMKLVGLLNAPDYPCEEAHVGCARRVVSVPSRPLPDPDPIREQVEAARKALSTAANEADRARKAVALRHAEEKWERISLGAGPFPAEVQVIRLGSVALVGIPGEPFAELGVALKQQSAAPGAALCVGYANDYLGYIVPRSAWELGGYEVGLGMWSIVGPEAFEMLLEGARSLMGQLWA